MSFPILRVDLLNKDSPKLNISSVELPETSTFIEKRVLVFSKQIAQAAKDGKTTCTINIVVQRNVEPVTDGLKVNFPDIKFTFTPTSVGGRGSTPVVVDWS